MKKKKGFTMIELLSGALIASILMGMTIVLVKDSQETEFFFELKNGMEHSISLSQNEYATNFSYENLIDNTYSDSSGDGLSEVKYGEDFIKLNNKNIEITSLKKTCSDGSAGILIKASNDKITSFDRLEYDSCLSPLFKKIP